MIDESPFPPLPPEPQDPSIPWQPSNAVARCEASGGHIVRPATWPPTKRIRAEEPPSLSVQCARCSGWLVLFDPPPAGVNVIMPERSARSEVSKK